MGNAILSRLPVIGQERFRIHNRGGLRATTQCEDWVLEVATYHPHHDRRPLKKTEDFNEILSRSPLDQSFLVAGDFNAISHDDQHDLAALTVGFARFAKEPQAAANRFIEGGRAIFPVLQQQGLRDAIPVEQRQFSMPTDLIATDKGSAMHIDHVWVNEHLEVMQALVIKSEAGNHASDHHPIIVDLLPSS